MAERRLRLLDLLGTGLRVLRPDTGRPQRRDLRLRARRRGVCSLLRERGFDERIKGSHHIFSKEGVAEILNLQPKGAKAKPYQVQQVRKVILKYGLAGDDDD